MRRFAVMSMAPQFTPIVMPARDGMQMKTMLSSRISVADYKKMEESRDRKAIAEFMQHRLSERYIDPMRVDREKKNGFTIMAVSCLLIETLESFIQGWPDTKNKSQLAFCNFFDRNVSFDPFRGEAQNFYRHVRCGILHQGETTGGWHIRRNGTLFDKTTRTINAKRFHDEVEKVLTSYCANLQGFDWSTPTWQSFRKKMRNVCENCEDKA